MVREAVAVVALSLLAVLPAGAQDPSTPCEDQQFIQLRNKPVGQMTEREYEYFLLKDQECTQYRIWQAERREKALGEASRFKLGTTPAHGTYDWMEGRRRTSLSVYGGLAPSAGELTNYHGVGVSVGGGFAYQLNNQLAVDIISIDYDYFPLDEDKLKREAGASTLGSSVSTVAVMGGFHARLAPGRYSPFVGVGAGLIHGSVSEVTAYDDYDYYWRPGSSASAFGLSLGGGFEGRVEERSTAFTEIRVNIAFFQHGTAAYVPVRGGFRFHL